MWVLYCCDFHSGVKDPEGIPGLTNYVVDVASGSSVVSNSTTKIHDLIVLFMPRDRPLLLLGRDFELSESKVSPSGHLKRPETS